MPYRYEPHSIKLIADVSKNEALCFGFSKRDSLYKYFLFVVQKSSLKKFFEMVSTLNLHYLMTA